MTASDSKRLFVLDTNILMHDPGALFRFEEHDLYLPMTVLEELDEHKRGLSEVARNVRQTNRFLDDLLKGLSHEQITQGVPIKNGQLDSAERGRLFFQVEDTASSLPTTLPGTKADNSILATTLALQKTQAAGRVTLVSKDINMRIKANALGIKAEDYSSDQVLEDVNLLHQGCHYLPENFWEQTENLESWKDGGLSYYRLQTPLASAWCVNDCLFLEDGDKFQAIVREKNDDSVVLQVSYDYFHPKNAIWGISARNIEQNFAMNLLMDPNIDIVTIQGAAGSGKTLMALAAGLSQCMDRKLYNEIIMTRVTVPVGEDIGFLPGTEEEKMTPWMGALMDNLEVLHEAEGQGEWEAAATNDLIAQKIKIRSLNFMRGRTFLNRYIIIDEAQNLTSKQMKTLITRAGPGTKIVCLGDIAQIDTPYLSTTTSGLTYAIDRLRNWGHSGHMTLKRGERSRLAAFAADNF